MAELALWLMHCLLKSIWNTATQQHISNTNWDRTSVRLTLQLALVGSQHPIHPDSPASTYSLDPFCPRFETRYQYPKWTTYSQELRDSVNAVRQFDRINNLGLGLHSPWSSSCPVVRALRGQCWTALRLRYVARLKINSNFTLVARCHVRTAYT